MTGTIWEVVYDALDGLSVPVADGQLKIEDAAEYPPEYVVYFLVSAPVGNFADDGETVRNYKVQVNVFSVNGLTALPATVDAAMIAAGFIKGNPFEIPPDGDTGHFGLGTEYVITY